mmetsp:Transcript_17635/g.22455  ORF Transcript_17635/g.22455 Transcript_17635/m.22455 type:complete len:96 (+) Transcript_17635:82-369(+)
MVKFCRLARLQQDLGDATCAISGIKSKLSNRSNENIGGERRRRVLLPNEEIFSSQSGSKLQDGSQIVLYQLFLFQNTKAGYLQQPSLSERCLHWD